MSGPDPVVATPGYTFLPGGILLQWGLNGTAGNTSTTFPVAFTALYL